MGTKSHILVFGNSNTLGALASILRVSPLLHVVEQRNYDESALPGETRPDMILVDSAQATPEQFRMLLGLCPTILSIDPDTYQLTVLSSSDPANPLAQAARVIGALSFAL